MLSDQGSSSRSVLHACISQPNQFIIWSQCPLQEYFSSSRGILTSQACLLQFYMFVFLWIQLLRAHRIIISDVLRLLFWHFFFWKKYYHSLFLVQVRQSCETSLLGWKLVFALQIHSPNSCNRLKTERSARKGYLDLPFPHLCYEKLF